MFNFLILYLLSGVNFNHAKHQILCDINWKNSSQWHFVMFSDVRYVLPDYAHFPSD